MWSSATVTLYTYEGIGRIGSTKKKSVAHEAFFVFIMLSLIFYEKFFVKG